MSAFYFTICAVLVFVMCWVGNDEMFRHERKKSEYLWYAIPIMIVGWAAFVFIGAMFLVSFVHYCETL